MHDLDREALVDAWIAAANTHDGELFGRFFTDEATLHDPGVGRTFVGRAGIGEYYDTYFVGYDTVTRVIGVSPEGDRLRVDVHFTGAFPGEATDGFFLIALEGDRISSVEADLT